MKTLEPQAELLAKQHALRVESYAADIGHAVRDQFEAGRAGHQELAG